MKTLLLITGLLILSSGSSCLDSQTVLPGQIGQISDAAVVSCKAYPQAESTHQCLILTNPYQAAVKVFDITDNQFILSPIAYFPLVIKVGLAPNKVVVAGDQIFTLDPVDKKIYIIPGDFKSPVTNALPALDASYAAFAITLEAGQPKTHLSEPGDTNLLVTPDQKHLLRTNKATLSIEDPKTSQLLLKRDFLSTIASIAADSTQAVIGLTDKTLVIIELPSGKDIVTMSPDLKNKQTAIAAAVYMPSGNFETCCNGEKQWVAALMMDGTLQYWPYADGVFKEPQKYNIQLTTGVGAFALTNPVKLLGAIGSGAGGDALGCERRLFLIYSGAIFNTCEGNSNIKRVDQMEY